MRFVIPDWLQQHSDPPRWRPRPSPGGAVAAAAALPLLGVAIAAWAYALSQPAGPGTIVGAIFGTAGVLLGALALLLAWGTLSMHYWLGDGDLTIGWLWSREVIPVASIEALYRGHRVGKLETVKGLVWLGHYLGSARSEELGALKLYATSLRAEDMVVVATSAGSFALTPEDLDGFRAHLVKRLDRLTEREIAAAPAPHGVEVGLAGMPAIRDRTGTSLLAAALVVLIVSVLYVAVRLAGPSEGASPGAVASASEAFHLPLVGAFLLALNLVLVAIAYLFERPTGRILAAAALFVQAAMLVAITRVVH